MTWPVPAGVELVILALGAYRLTRFLGWDEWPPIAALRTWATGWRVPRHDEGPDPVLVRQRPAWLDQLFSCPFCLGWWVSLAVAVTWYVSPTFAVVALLPWALSGAVGLLAKNLDP